MKSYPVKSQRRFGGMMTKFFCLLLGLFALPTLTASASVYFTVTSGEGLSPGEQDTAFTLASQPGPDTYTAIYSTSNFANFGYVAPPIGSAWISVSAAGNSVDSGNYDYRYSYSSDFSAPTTLFLTGSLSADNAVTLEIDDAGSYATASAPGGVTFESLYPIDTSYTIGIGSVTTTFDFIVDNEGGPSALYVNLSASTPLTTVPEPSTWALLLGGLGLLAFGHVRRTVS